MSRAFTIRGFVAAAGLIPVVPLPDTARVKVTQLGEGSIEFDVDKWAEMVVTTRGDQVIYKSRAVGPTVGILENALAFYNVTRLGAPPWVDSDRRADLRNGLIWLNEQMRKPRRRPDQVIIEGVVYGPKDELPPPFGRGR